jgi:DNA-directed RNA polymerase specialized sigma24 family protein
MKHPTDRVSAVIRSPAFRESLPRRRAYAALLLRANNVREGEGWASAAAQPGDIVNEVVADCLDGTRGWGEGVPFDSFFRDAIKSKVYHRCSGERRRRGTPIDEIDEPTAPPSRREERRDACAELAVVREALSVDARTRAVLEAIEGGASSRAEVAAELGWNPKEVSLARKAMRRRLAAAGLRGDQEDDDE